LGNGTRSRGFLAVGRSGVLPPAERHVVNAAALLLVLRLEQSRALDSALAALRAALLRLLLAGEDATVAEVVRELGTQLPAEPLLVVGVDGTDAQRVGAVDVVADASAQEHAAFFSAELDGLLVLLLPAGGPVAAALDALSERVPGAAFGVSAPQPWARLAEGLRQARQAVEHGRARTRPVTGFADLAVAGLGSLLDPAGTRAFAEALLSPLADADRAGAGDLVESVRVWLAHHGQWEPAAAALGVHRHTLRKRVRRAEELLGRDLDEPGTRAELWIALHAPA
jgi:purine catabolism regulator